MIAAALGALFQIIEGNAYNRSPWKGLSEQGFTYFFSASA
jgi:hypothetical protein